VVNPRAFWTLDDLPELVGILKTGYKPSGLPRKTCHSGNSTWLWEIAHLVG